MSRLFLLTLFSIIIMTEGCNSQNKEQHKNDRKPAVAGQFYAGDSATLAKDLKNLFEKALPGQVSDVLAVISPHAGYIFSGSVAATAFNQIDANKEYENIFIIGSSHQSYFDAASVYCEGDFITPLGTVEVNTAIATELIEKNPIFKNYKDAHFSSTVWKFSCRFCSTK